MQRVRSFFSNVLHLASSRLTRDAAGRAYAWPMMTNQSDAPSMRPGQAGQSQDRGDGQPHLRAPRARAGGATDGVPPLCWPFPPGSQNNTDKAVKLKPYVPPKRRSLNQY